MDLNGLLHLVCVFRLSSKVQVKNLIVGLEKSEALMVCDEFFWFLLREGFFKGAMGQEHVISSWCGLRTFLRIS